MPIFSKTPARITEPAVGAFIAAIFHVFTHAFFKALLFLGSGSVIHGMHHEQDMRRMGGLQKYLPTTYKTMMMGWLAICGIIPFAGFWSKDEILWKTFSTDLFSGKIFWFIAFITAGMTAFYMTRLMALTFWGEERFRHAHADDHHAQHDDHDAHGHHGTHEPHESPRSMTTPLIVLAAFSVFIGLIGITPALSFGKNINLFEHWLEPVIQKPSATPHAASGPPTVSAPDTQAAPATAVTAAASHGEEAHHIEPIEYLLIALSLGIAIGGIYLGRLFYVQKPELAKQWGARLQPLYRLSANKWYWDWLLDHKGVAAGKAVNNALWKVDAAVVDGGVNGAGALTRLWAQVSNLWDKYVVDLLVNATGWVTKAGSIVLRTAQTGFWQNYALVFALGLFVILLFYVYPAVKTFFGR